MRQLNQSTLNPKSKFRNPKSLPPPTAVVFCLAMLFSAPGTCDSRLGAGVGWGLADYFTPSSTFPREGIALPTAFFNLPNIYERYTK